MPRGRLPAPVLIGCAAAMLGNARMARMRRGTRVIVRDMDMGRGAREQRVQVMLWSLTRLGTKVT